MSDWIDSRDLIEELAAFEAADEDELDEDDRERMQAIRELADSGIEDWQYGATLIHEDNFEDYARELAEDIGAIDKDASWPNTYIDWPAAADALGEDYTTVEFLGDTYYTR